jgi:CubicO group peptidase (beta-lactamase class C family)
MPRRSFRILYREFLFRVVDRELLSTYAAGDAHQLFTQIAAVLVFFTFAISFPALDRNAGLSAPLRLFFSWRFEHFLIATTMLTVGLFAVLSWGSMFPDHRDVLVLAPLPVRARTILLAKLAAIATALALVVLAMHAVAGLVWPWSLSRATPPIVMPAVTRVPAIPPVGASDLQAVLDRDLAGARDHGWLSPHAGGGLAIAIAQRSERHVFTYGAAQPDSIFQIGSITKTFTASALARMIVNGRVQLDTPVRELIPAATLAQPAGREITLLDLATHRSGLPNMPPGVRPDRLRSPFARVNRNSLYTYMRTHGVERPADSAFIYSNLGFGLLGHALANRMGTDYATLIRELVTEPLGLDDTVVDLSPQQRRRVLQGYDDEGHPIGLWEFDVLAGAGAMYSTAPDLLRWLEANLHPAGPMASALELSQQPRRPTRGNGRIGLAWWIDAATGNIEHGGAVGGYNADAFFNRKDDVALVVLTNRGQGVGAEVSRVADHIRSRLAGAPAIALDDVVIPAAGGYRSWLRTLFAYWITMIAASVFVAGLMMALQGLATAWLPRRYFLRVSPLMQLGSFAMLVGWYLLQPLGFTTDDLLAAQSGGLFSASPSYWFLGLFQALNGSNVLPALAARAWIGVGLTIALAVLAYGVSYVRTIRGIAEEPDVTTAVRVRQIPLFGHGPTRGLFDFALKTLFRSAQPRVVMAFFWGLGLAFVVAFVKSPRGQQFATIGDTGAWYEASLPLLVASILMMGAAVLAARSAFAMPRDLSANWIFKILLLRDARAPIVARRRALLAVSVAPVCAISAIALFSMWPWMPAAGHLIALALLGLTIVEAVERDTRRIPFACSYLPGHSRVHIAIVIVVLLIIPIVVGAARLEKDALRNGTLYVMMVAALGVTWLAARLRTRWLAPSADAPPVFDAEPEDRVVTLELWDSRVTKDTKASPSVA